MSSLLGTAGGIAQSSYLEAIRCALELLGIGPGSSVVVSPLAPVEYGEALRRRGAEPLLADVDPSSGVVSPAAVRRLLERRPQAVILHHTLGQLPEPEGFQDLGVPVIEDVSQSLGGWTPDRPAALIGDLVLLSLDPANLLTAGAGGLLLARARKDWKALRELGESGGPSARLADMNAALGLSQLRELGRFLAQRREIGNLFLQSVSRTAHRPLVPKGEGEYCYFSFPVLLEHGLKEVRQYAQKKEIETRLAYAGSILERALSAEVSEGREAAGAAAPLRPAVASAEPLRGSGNAAAVPGPVPGPGPVGAAGVGTPTVGAAGAAGAGPADGPPEAARGEGVKAAEGGAEQRGIGSPPPPAPVPAPAATPEARNLLLRCLLFPLYPSLGRRNVDTISKVLMTLP